MPKKGFKHTEESNKKRSLALKGIIKFPNRILSEEHKKKISKRMMGHITTKETREKIRLKHLGRKHSEEHNKKVGITMSLKMKGRMPKNIELLKQRSPFKKGHKSFFNIEYRPWNYIDGRSKLLGPARYGDDWDDIRKIIYRRDYYTCQSCGIKGIPLDVHHIIPFLDGGSNELDNLISLCRSCHSKIEVKIRRTKKWCPVK